MVVTFKEHVEEQSCGCYNPWTVWTL